MSKISEKVVKLLEARHLANTAVVDLLELIHGDETRASVIEALNGAMTVFTVYTQMAASTLAYTGATDIDDKTYERLAYDVESLRMRVEAITAARADPTSEAH